MKESLKKNLESLKKVFRNLPSKSQWKMFFKILTKKEKIIFLFCLVCFWCTLIVLSTNFYCKNTQLVPAQGGIYIEGIVGQPRFINPVLQFNDIDRSLTELMFSGLMKYEKDGKIVPDLVQEYQILEEGAAYEVILRDNIFWHDGQEITVDDVVFTIETIQDLELKSPELANWIDVEVRKISNQKIIFRLQNSYFPFLERLTIKILPKHIFGEVPAENFPLTIYNLQPIGSGPFKFQKIKYNKLGQVESLDLIRNQNYFEKLPYLEKIRILFFETEEELVRAVRKKQVQGFTIADPESLAMLEENGFALYEISLPRYFSIFLNTQESDILAKKEVREALELGINKTEILERVIKNRGTIVTSPLLPELYGFEEPTDQMDYNQEQAKALLERAGLVQKDGKFFEIETEATFSFEKRLEKGSKGKEVESLQECLSFFPDIYPEGEVTGYFGENTEQAVIAFQEKYKKEILEPWGFEQGTGLIAKTTREKLNEVCNQFLEQTTPIKFSLATVDQPFLVETARFLEEQWEKLGLEIKIIALEFNELSRELIKPRKYEMLLFGEALGIIPDPLAFWHSSRIKDPGLNLALYESKKADEFLKQARMAQDFEEFKQNLEAFQNILLEDSPAIFLYRPHFLYFVSRGIKGADFEIISEPSKRFIDIENWYLKTQRIWK